MLLGARVLSSPAGSSSSLVAEVTDVFMWTHLLLAGMLMHFIGISFPQLKLSHPGEDSRSIPLLLPVLSRKQVVSPPLAQHLLVPGLIPSLSLAVYSSWCRASCAGTKARYSCFPLCTNSCAANVSCRSPCCCFPDAWQVFYVPSTLMLAQAARSPSSLHIAIPAELFFNHFSPGFESLHVFGADQGFVGGTGWVLAWKET